MTKYDYLTRLKHYLQPLPQKERNAAIRHYDKFFTDAGPENEYKVMESLGNPKELAEKIMNNKNSISSMINQTKSNVRKVNKKMNSSQRKKMILITILLSPLWLSIIFLIFCAMIMLFLAAAGVLIFMLAAGIFLFCMSIPYMSTTLSLGLLLLGMGLILASLPWLISSPIIKFVFFVFKMTVKAIVLLFNKTISRKAVIK